MSSDAACREPYGHNPGSPELEDLLAKLDEFRDGFLADLHAMERRMIRTMVCTMLGGVLTIAVIGLIVSVAAG